MPAGAYPIDPTTDVGKLRLLLGDSIGVEFDPPVPGERDYPQWSDDELEQFIAAAGDSSITRAASYAYLQMAASAAAESVTVRTQDLSADLTRRSEAYRLLAKQYADLADGEDAASGAGEAFEVVPTGSYGPTHWPEAAAYPFWR